MHKTKYKCSLHINLNSQFIIVINNIIKSYFLAFVKARFVLFLFFFKFERVITLFHLLNESVKASHSANLPICSHRHFSPNSNVLTSSYRPQLVVVTRQSFLSNSKEPTFLVNTGADGFMLALALV